MGCFGPAPQLVGQGLVGFGPQPAGAVGSGQTQHLGVGTGNQHPGAHLQLHVQKGPAPRQVLQRPALAPLLAQLRQLGGLGIVQRTGQSGVGPIQSQPHQLHRLKRQVGGVDARLSQRLFHQLHTAAAGQPGKIHHHRLSSQFSGSTGFTAAMATSIMLSSGSLVVSR